MRRGDTDEFKEKTFGETWGNFILRGRDNIDEFKEKTFPSLSQTGESASLNWILAEDRCFDMIMCFFRGVLNGRLLTEGLHIYFEMRSP